MNEKNYKILLVDDNPANLQLLDSILFDQGYVVLIAKNGKQAVNLAKTKKPDLILLDVAMPDMDGFEVFRELKSLPETCDILVVFVSALNESDDVIRGLSMGAIDYVTKPFNADELVPRINNYLALKSRGDIFENAKQESEKHLLSQTQMFANMTSNIMKRLQRAEDVLESLIVSPKIGQDDKIKIDEAKYDIHNSYDQLEKMELRSKIINNQIKADCRPFDLDGTLKNCIKRYAGRAKSKGITLLYENPGPKPVVADLSLVYTVLRNLLSNAVKFTAGGGDIIVNAQRYDRDQNYFLITVYDTGQGMTAEKAAQVLSENALKNTDDKNPGLGLGIASHFVKLCGGKIWVESMPGIGSDFKFTLPAQKL